MTQLGGIFLAIAGAYFSLAAATAPMPEPTVTGHAMGTFEVKLENEAVAGKTADPSLGQMSISKTFAGDLDGTSTGSMLTAATPVHGSAAYVAIEKVTGILGGRKGTFILQHSGTLSRGQGALNIMVVPDSGTGQLSGLTGRLAIKIENGKHYYEFNYSLPASK